MLAFTMGLDLTKYKSQLDDGTQQSDDFKKVIDDLTQLQLA